MFILPTWKIHSHPPTTPPLPKVSFHDRIRIRFEPQVHVTNTRSRGKVRSLGHSSSHTEDLCTKGTGYFLHRPYSQWTVEAHTEESPSRHSHSKMVTMDAALAGPSQLFKLSWHMFSVPCEEPSSTPGEWFSVAPSRLLALSFESLFLFHNKTEFETQPYCLLSYFLT